MEGLECTGSFYSTVPRCCCCCCCCCCCLCWGWEEPWGGELVHRTAGNRKGCYWKNKASTYSQASSATRKQCKLLGLSDPLMHTHLYIPACVLLRSLAPPPTPTPDLPLDQCKLAINGTKRSSQVLLTVSYGFLASLL